MKSSRFRLFLQMTMWGLPQKSFRKKTEPQRFQLRRFFPTQESNTFIIIAGRRLDFPARQDGVQDRGHSNALETPAGDGYGYGVQGRHADEVNVHMSWPSTQAICAR